MSGTLAIVVFFTGLLFIILIHEAGHYLVARAFGFKVEQYFVGFGPKIWSFTRKDIEYGVKALPLGGYVKIAGMNPYEPVPPEDLPRSYGAKPIWQRALVILAGPGSHFIVAAILFTSWLVFFGDPRTPTPFISGVETTLNGHAGPAAVASGAVSCVLTPEQTEGPYYIAGEKLRRNITEGRPGVPLLLRLQVVDASTCRPIVGASGPTRPA